MNERKLHGIDFVESGTGTIPILFVPGSYSTHVAWKAIQENLPDRYRFIGTSLRGYGSTCETRTEQQRGIQHNIEIVQQIAKVIDEPFHLVGHSFGGTVSLASSLLLSEQLLSLVTFEANPMYLLKECGRDELFESSMNSADQFLQACKMGDPDAAGHVIDFWGGRGAFSNMPSTVQDYCRNHVSANVHDWHDVYEVQIKEQLSALNIPVLLVRGGLANPHMIGITSELNALVTGSKMEMIEGAGHFLISTHPDQCAETMIQFYRQNNV